MTLTALAAVPPNTFTPEDREAVATASHALRLVDGRGAVHIEAQAGQGERQTFVLPMPAVHLVRQILTELAAGRGVSVMHTDATLTTQQAADMLNVSRPYLVKLLESGALRFHMANTHRRIALQDLLAYRAAQKERADQALDFLAAQAQDLNMGY